MCLPACHRVRWSLLVVSALTALLHLTACGSLDQASLKLAGIVSPYKMDIVQGNFVSREQVVALREGMSRVQVRDILGTSLLTSVFHADRWDYVFSFKRPGLEPQARRVTVFFKDDVLSKIESDDLPTEAEFVATLGADRQTGTVPVLELPVDALPPPVRSASAAPVPLPPLPSSYPPLEAETARR